MIVEYLISIVLRGAYYWFPRINNNNNNNLVFGDDNNDNNNEHEEYKFYYFDAKEMMDEDAAVKEKVDALCDTLLSQEELCNNNLSDELLDYTESRIEEIHESIKQAKARRKMDQESSWESSKDIPINKLPAELAGIVASSGFLSSKDLGRFLLMTSKSITEELSVDTIWRTILQSHISSADNSSSSHLLLQPMIKTNGYEWVFRQLLRESVHAPAYDGSPFMWEEPSTTLSSKNMTMLLSLRNQRDDTAIFSKVLTEEEVDLLQSHGNMNFPFQIPEAFANIIQGHESPPVYMQLHCFRLDTNQSCCVLSDGLVLATSEVESGADGQRVWSRMDFGDASEQGALKMSMAGRAMLARDYYKPNGYEIDPEDVSDVRSGMNFDVSINFGDEPSITVDVSVFSCGAVNSLAGSFEGISLFTVMDTLDGWM